MMRYLYDDYMAERAEWMPVTPVKRSRTTAWIAAGLFWGLVAVFVEWWRR